MKNDSGPKLISWYLSRDAVALTSSYLQSFEVKTRRHLLVHSYQHNQEKQSDAYERLANPLTVLCNVLFLDSYTLSGTTLDHFAIILRTLTLCATDISRFIELGFQEATVMIMQIATVFLLIFRRSQQDFLVSALSRSNLPLSTSPEKVLIAMQLIFNSVDNGYLGTHSNLLDCSRHRRA